jgi:hypothetical protein
MSFAAFVPDETAPAEKRALRRNRVLLAATLVHGEQMFTALCTIRNLTDRGAAVRLDSALPLPPTVTLIETRSGRAHECRIVWRRGGFLGLAFTRTRDLHNARRHPMRRLWSVNQLR